jgi:hypothetical protein
MLFATRAPRTSFGGGSSGSMWRSNCERRVSGRLERGPVRFSALDSLCRRGSFRFAGCLTLEDELRLAARALFADTRFFVRVRDVLEREGFRFDLRMIPLPILLSFLRL